MDIITLAAWLHDLDDRKGSNTKKIEKFLKENNINSELLDKVVLAIKEHSLRKKQTATESKVLFDADKLEYINPVRIIWAMQSFKDGFLNKSQYSKYYHYWRKIISKVPALMHFEYSKLEFRKMRKQVIKDIERCWNIIDLAI